MTRYGIAVAAMIAGPLLVAYVWGQSQLGADYRAMQEAKRQCDAVRGLGVVCDEEARARPRRPKTDGCGARASLNRPVSS